MMPHPVTRMLIIIAVAVQIIPLSGLRAQDTISNQYFISGTIRKAGTPEVLAGAEIRVEGSTRGTLTNNEGKFSLRLGSGKHVLVCSFMGFHEKRIPVTLHRDLDLNIDLEVRQFEIDEVYVIASLRNEDPIVIGRPIENIGADILSTLNTNDVNDALHGRIPGVWNTKISGAPGDHNRIRIRGLNSIFGSPDPLYVVDGMVIPVVNSITLGISDLNSHDVENISVLKDASSTALYGYLGGNGVILIDTKKGGGRNRLSFSYKKGFQTLYKRYDLLNSEDFLNTTEISDLFLFTWFDRYDPSQGIYPKYPEYIDPDGNPLGSDDPQDLLFKTGNLSEYNLSGQGSVKGFDYYISGNYYNHYGIVANTRYTKYTLTANVSRDIGTKFKLRLLYKGSHQEHYNTLDNYLGNTVIFKGLTYEPSFNYTPDSIRMQKQRLYYLFLGTASRSAEILNSTLLPEELIWDQEKSRNDNIHAGTITGEYKIHPNLLVNAAVSVSFRKYLYASILPGQGQFLKSNEGVIALDQQYDMKYHKSFGSHTVDAMARYTYHRDNAFWEIDSLENVYYLYPTYNDVFLRGSQARYGTEGSVNRKLSSCILNLNYNYRNRYFISFIGNYSSLSEGHYVKRNNFFPSVTVNWDLAREDFLQSVRWLDAFNLYVNWGQAGNYPLNSLSNDLYYTDYIYASGRQIVGGAGISNLANHFLVHEEVTETNAGARISLLGERLKPACDFYIRNYNDLLIYRPIPPYYGGGLFFDNIGTMINRGVELSLELIPVERNAITWVSKAGFSTNEQYLTSLHDGIPVKLTSPDPLYPDFIIDEDLPLGDITGYKYLGKWKDLSEADREREDVGKWLGLAYLKPDSTSYYFSDKDKTVIGNSIPDFTFNWTNLVEFRNLTCEMHWYGVVGVEKYNATKAATYIKGNHPGLRSMVLDTIRGINDRIFYESSFFVEDASFVRLKTLRFSYHPSRKIAGRVGWEISLSFENLVTLTRYSGFDPEASIYTDNTFTDNAMDWGAYPNPRGYFISMNLEF